jgi:hypothetical protein
VPRGFLTFYDPSVAQKLPKQLFNVDVYYAIAGDDGDFLIG